MRLFGELGGRPASDTLEAAAAWAEAHPANAPEPEPEPERTATISLGPDGLKIEPAPAPEKCSCGFVHDGCSGPECMFMQRKWNQWPCKRCGTGLSDAAKPCHYHPAGPPMTDCPACGLRRVVTVGDKRHCLHCGRVEHVDEGEGEEDEAVD